MCLASVCSCRRGGRRRSKHVTNRNERFGDVEASHLFEIACDTKLAALCEESTVLLTPLAAFDPTFAAMRKGARNSLSGPLGGRDEYVASSLRCCCCCCCCCCLSRRQHQERIGEERRGWEGRGGEEWERRGEERRREERRGEG